MIYNFPDLLKSHPEIVGKALQSGNLESGNMLIVLPDGFDFGTNPPTPVIRGLGDRIARFAQPTARIIDGIFGTNIQECEGCKKRQEDLNTQFPSKSQ